MVRLKPDDARNIQDQAHAGRVPVAVFCRELLLGRLPPKAPPALEELSVGATQLLKIVHGCISNLAQLDAHCSRSGPPLFGLSGPAGPLQKLAATARMIGLQIKAGTLDPARLQSFLESLEAPGRDLNERLACPINQGQVPEPQTWHDVLRGLQAALPEA